MEKQCPAHFPACAGGQFLFCRSALDLCGADRCGPGAAGQPGGGGVLTLPLTAAEIVYHAPGTYDRSLYPGLPPELGQLQNLTRLLLDNNPWTGCLPVAWRDQGLRFSEPLPFCTD